MTLTMVEEGVFKRCQDIVPLKLQGMKEAHKRFMSLSAFTRAILKASVS